MKVAAPLEKNILTALRMTAAAQGTDAGIEKEYTVQEQQL